MSPGCGHGPDLAHTVALCVVRMRTCFFFSAMRKASCEHVCHQDAGMAQTWRIRLLSVLSRLVEWPRLVAYLGDQFPTLAGPGCPAARHRVCMYESTYFTKLYIGIISTLSLWWPAGRRNGWESRGPFGVTRLQTT